MKNNFFFAFTLFFTMTITQAFAQAPDANFVPKNSIADNLLTGDNTVLLVIDGDLHRYQIAEGLVSIEELERNALQAASLFKQGIFKSKMRAR